MSVVIAECHFSNYAECQISHYAKCRYAECRLTECRGAFMTTQVKDMFFFTSKRV